MSLDKCPNYANCQLVHQEGFLPDKTRQQSFVQTYCLHTEGGWSSCKRYMTKKAWNICPDFVLPDTDLSVDDILDRFEEQEMSK